MQVVVFDERDIGGPELAATSRQVPDAGSQESASSGVTRTTDSTPGTRQRAFVSNNVRGIGIVFEGLQRFQWRPSFGVVAQLVRQRHVRAHHRIANGKEVQGAVRGRQRFRIHVARAAHPERLRISFEAQRSAAAGSRQVPGSRQVRREKRILAAVCRQARARQFAVTHFEVLLCVRAEPPQTGEHLRIRIEFPNSGSGTLSARPRAV